MASIEKLPSILSFTSTIVWNLIRLEWMELLAKLNDALNAQVGIEKIVDSPTCSSSKKSQQFELLSSISPAKAVCKGTFDLLILFENYLQCPSEETAEQLKLLFDRGKNTCVKFQPLENVDEIFRLLRDVTGKLDAASNLSESDKKTSKCENKNLDCDLDYQTCSISQEALNSEKVKTILPLSSVENTCDGNNECKTSVGDLVVFEGLHVLEHTQNDRKGDEGRKKNGKTHNEEKLERESAQLTSRLRETLVDIEILRKENSSLKEQLRKLETEHMEILCEFGRITVEQTAEKNKNRGSDLFLQSIFSGKDGHKSDSLSVSLNPKKRIVDDDYNVFLMNDVYVSSSGSDHDQVAPGAQALSTNGKVKTNLQEDEHQNVWKSVPNSHKTATNCDGKSYDESEETVKEKSSSSFATTSADERENQGSTQASSGDVETPFSVQQDYPTDYISLSNQPTTSVATTLYNNYKLLLLTLAKRLLSSEAELLKNWAQQNFSVNPSQKVTEVLFQLDHKEIINASDLSRLKNFFESILRIDLVYIIDAFLLGDYDMLRVHPRKPEVNANKGKRFREKAGSGNARPLYGASSNSATSKNDVQGNPERRTESNDEAHLLRQTPFPSFQENKDATSVTHPSTYKDLNPLSKKHGYQKFTPQSTRFANTMIAKGIAADGPVTRQVDHDGQDGNAARTPIRDEMSDTDHTQKRRFPYGAIYQTMRALAILRCLHGSEMVLLGVVIGENQLSSNSSKSSNSHVTQSKNVQIVGSNGFELSRSRQPNTEQSNSRSPRNQAPDDDVQGNWLCSHYKRRCFVKFECCDKFWPCHRCHNNQSTCGRKKLKSRDTKKLKCANCSKVQEFGQYCRDCNAKFAMYYCGLCKHLTGTDDHPYHCEKCGICRIHGDRSFHCDICGVCLDVQLRGNHKCREGSAHDECCICLEDAFTGCQILPCSHKVHKECATQMIRSGIRRCPICRESFAHKLERRPMSDQRNRSRK